MSHTATLIPHEGHHRMLCGCFSCLHVFLSTEVIDWIDDGETPLCPTCGMDTVMPGVTDPGELHTLRLRRFGGPGS